ncbi:hypothetical protein HDU93_008292 [Gonapodya sp. JEL0774]|nr:hypothetical protein HDU93_008292 [Gonapodya sp. JEL0774]
MIRGFVLALASLIIIEQAPGMLGIDKAALEPEPINNEPYEPTPFQKLASLISHLGMAHTPTVIVSICTVSILQVLRAFKRSSQKLQLLPEVLLVMIMATTLSWRFEWADAGIPVLGPAQGGLVAPALPNLRPGAVRGLTTPAVLVSIIGFVEAITASKHLAAHHNEPLRPNRELVALGMNNIVGSAVGAFPSFGSLPRSIVNDRAGARTQMAGLVTATVVLFTCLFAMPLLQPLPQCVLSSVICVVAADLLEFEELLFLATVRGWSDLAMAGVTFFATSFVGVESGTILSISASLLLVVRETAGVSIEVMGRVKVPRLDRSGAIQYKYKYVGLSGDVKAARQKHEWDGEGADVAEEPNPNESADGGAWGWGWLWGVGGLTSKKFEDSDSDSDSHGGVNSSSTGETISSPTTGKVPLTAGSFPVLKIPGILLLRISEPLFFGNVGHLREQIRRAEMYGELGAHPGEDPPSAQEAGGGNALFGVVMEVSGVTTVDPSMVSSFSDRRVSVCFVKLPPSCYKPFERAGLLERTESSGGGFFGKIGDAVDWLEEAEQGKKRQSVLSESLGQSTYSVAGVGQEAGEEMDHTDRAPAKWARDRAKGLWRKLRASQTLSPEPPLAPITETGEADGVASNPSFARANTGTGFVDQISIAFPFVGLGSHPPSPTRAQSHGTGYHNVVPAEDQIDIEAGEDESSGDELDSGTLKSLQRQRTDVFVADNVPNLVRRGHVPPTAMSDNIKIAVRIRPFNDREKSRNARLIASMHDATTEIVDPEKGGEPHKFTFDYSFWSHDGFIDKDGVLEPQAGSNYADQRRVFDELGRLVLDNALAGYNSTLMAYGQTGSGKSYSMFGYGKNRGIIPIVCEELFKKISNGNPNLVYQMQFSTIEIYNEQVRDLLSDSGESLKVRQNPQTGFFVEGLKQVAVTSYAEVEELIEKGTKNKTVAATNSEKENQIDKISNTEKLASIHLVDLAGSERIASTGAQGARLKEATNINGSLSCLGNVIAALVQQQQGKKGVAVPFRDSVLTKILANSLGGNSKTIMIAAISPADINYDESLSTLRFVDRAKQIKTSAVVNESSTDKLIRELKEENERLRKLCEEKEKIGGGESAKAAEGMSEEEKEAFEKLQNEIAEKEAQVRHLAEQNKSWEQKLEEAKKEFERQDDKSALEISRETTPCLTNLNEDPLLSKMLFWFIKGGEHVVGKKQQDSKADIQLNGLGIQPLHCVIKNVDGVLSISVMNKAAIARVNGKLITAGSDPTTLAQNDRVLLGNQLFLVKFPKVVDDASELTWIAAQAEIAKELGLGQSTGEEPIELQNVYDEIMSLLPLVTEINTISDTLKQGLRFELMVTSADGGDGSFGDGNDGYKILIKVSDTLKGLKWVWKAEQFQIVAIKIQDFYSSYMSSKGAALLPYNPFELPVEDFRLGTAAVDLSKLSSGKVATSATLIRDFKGSNEGLFRVEASIQVQGGELIKESSELLGKDCVVRIKLLSIVGLRWRKGDVKCSYEFWNTRIRTDSVQEATNITFNHETPFNVTKVDESFLDYIKKPLVITLWGDHSNSLESLKRKAQEAALREAEVAQAQTVVDVEPFKEEIARLSVQLANKDKEHTAEIQKVRTDVVFKTKQLADEVSRSNVQHTQIMSMTAQINTLNALLQSSTMEATRMQQVIARNNQGGFLDGCFGTAETGAAYQNLLTEIETLKKEKQLLLQESSNLKSDAIYVASREETMERMTRLDGLVKEMHRIAYLLDPGRASIVDNRPPTLTATGAASSASTASTSGGGGSSQAKDPNASSGVSVGVIAGAAAGGVLVLIGIVVAIIYFRKKKDSDGPGKKVTSGAQGYPAPPPQGYAPPPTQGYPPPPPQGFPQPGAQQGYAPPPVAPTGNSNFSGATQNPQMAFAGPTNNAVYANAAYQNAAPVAKDVMVKGPPPSSSYGPSSYGPPQSIPFVNYNSMAVPTSSSFGQSPSGMLPAGGSPQSGQWSGSGGSRTTALSGLSGSTAIQSAKLYERLGGQDGGKGLTMNAQATAIAGWTPNAPDELYIAEGDVVLCETVFADDWCYGQNLSRGPTGIFPAAILGDSPFGLQGAQTQTKIGPRIASVALGAPGSNAWR